MTDPQGSRPAEPQRATWASNTDPWTQIQYESLVSWTADFIVYVDKAIELQWETTEAYDSSCRKNPKCDIAKHNGILSDVGILDARARRDFGLDTRKEALCLIGNAVVWSLDFDYVSAQKALVGAQDFLRERSGEASRLWYLSASAMMAAPFLVGALIIWLSLPSMVTRFGLTVTWLFLAACAGALGALFSVIMRTGRLNLDPWAGRKIHYAEGASRIWAGAFSGLIAGLAIKAGLLLNAVAVTERNSVIILAAIAAGSSERLASSIISKIDSERGRSDPASSRANPSEKAE